MYGIEELYGSMGEEGEKVFQELREILQKGRPIPEEVNKYQLNLHLGARRQWEFPWMLLNGDFQEGMNVLNIGSGSTPIDVFLARRGCEVDCIDPRFIGNRLEIHRDYMDSQVFTDKDEELKDKVNYKYHDGAKLKFKSNNFDRVITSAVIKHLKPEILKELIQEMKRVTKKEGLIIITTDRFHHKDMEEPLDHQFELLLKESKLPLVAKEVKYGNVKEYLEDNPDNTSHHIEIYDTLPYGLILQMETVDTKRKVKKEKEAKKIPNNPPPK